MAQARRLYFVNPIVDFLLMGGASILIFALFWLFYVPERTTMVISIGSSLLWVLNWPHFSATNYRLYRDKKNINEYSMTAVFIPLVVATAMVGALASPLGVAPFLVKLFLLWSPFHSSGQAFGVTLLYAHRAGISMSGWPRLALSTAMYGGYFTSILKAETSSVPILYYGIQYPRFDFPKWSVFLGLGITALALAAFLFFTVKWSLKEKRVFPLIILTPVGSLLVWFLISARWTSYQEFVPAFHCLQYLFIAWAMHLREQGKETGKMHESLKWYGMNIAGGAFMFLGLPFLVSKLGWPYEFATGVVLSGVQIHHFFVDGVIWKLRDKTVQRKLVQDAAYS